MFSPIATSIYPEVATREAGPMLVAEQSINLFTFYLADTLLAGMRYQNELYGLVGEVDAQKQLEAYNLACALMVQGEPAVVTVSSEGYKVWISLRSPAYTAALPCP